MGGFIMPKYRVEMKKFKDGTWYVKTETDSKAAAISVAHNKSNGREYNVIECGPVSRFSTK